MALLSLGAAVENLMLTATDRGLASCWVAAPIFCPEEARDALALPAEWLPHALVLVGRPDPAYVGRARPPVPLDEIRRFAVANRRAGSARRGALALKCSRVRARPSSSDVNGFQPRWISARPGSTALRCSSPVRGGL